MDKEHISGQNNETRPIAKHDTVENKRLTLKTKWDLKRMIK